MADTQYKGDDGIKKGTKWLVFLLVAVFMVAGCGKKSGLEGKVLDGKGQPISGLNVFAIQVKPIKGYEQFEAKTGSDGTFSFNGLYPSSDYVLSFSHKDWRTEEEAMVTAGPEGETILLKAPIQIQMALNTKGNPVDPQTGKPRFVVSNDGVITDSLTGLEWVAWPDTDTNWNQAQAWCGGLSLAGGGWRMPTRADLETLYIKGLGKRNMAQVFITTGWFVWSGEQRDSWSAGVFDIRNGKGDWADHRDAGSGRAFAVRSRR